MVQPTPAQLAAANAAARQKINVLNSFYSGMISDDMISEVMNAGLTAALNVPSQPTKGPSK